MSIKKAENRHKNIVVVDGNEELLERWRDALTLDGHRVFTFQRALDALENHHILRGADVMLVDYHLRDLSGPELIREARTLEIDGPAILVAEAQDVYLRDRDHNLSNVEILFKPVGPADVMKSMAKLFGTLKPKV